jgi:hypothetical protein
MIDLQIRKKRGVLVRNKPFSTCSQASSKILSFGKQDIKYQNSRLISAWRKDLAMLTYMQQPYPLLYFLSSHEASFGTLRLSS